MCCMQCNFAHCVHECVLLLCILQFYNHSSLRYTTTVTAKGTSSFCSDGRFMEASKLRRSAIVLCRRVESILAFPTISALVRHTITLCNYMMDAVGALTMLQQWQPRQMLRSGQSWRRTAAADLCEHQEIHQPMSEGSSSVKPLGLVRLTKRSIQVWKAAIYVDLSLSGKKSLRLEASPGW